MGTATVSQFPAVSIIIPAYNTSGFVSACLDSVFAQTYRNFEVLVVNDGSPDTAQLDINLEPYMSRIGYWRQENKGTAGARNRAILQAKGEYLAFLDSDDTWIPQHLETQMSLFADDPALDLVYGNGLIVGDSSHHEFMARCPSHGEATFESLVVERCQPSISTVVARKACLVRAGLFDESLRRCEDYDMWLRAAFHGAKIGYTRRVLATFNTGRPGSLGELRVKMAHAYWRILENAKRNLPLSESQRTLVSQRADQIRARYLCEEGKCRLRARQFGQAREYLREANQHFRSTKLSLVVVGLTFAPEITRKGVELFGGNA